MKLDRIIAGVRERSAYEAGDLGFALARHADGAIWKPWFAATLPLFVLLNATGWWAGYPWIAGLLIWWLKPLFDRIPLFVLSRRLFSDTPSTGATLRATPGLWLDALPGALLWSRFDLARSFDLPVAQLEGLRGRERIRRQRVLQKTARAPAVWTTVGCAHIAAFFTLSAWVLLLLLVPLDYLPESVKAMWTLFAQHTTPAAQVAINLMAYLSMSVVEPFYVAAGFALYLNRRTQIEAWDVELVFRRIGARFRPVAVAATVLAALVVVVVPVTPARAAQPAAKIVFPLPSSLSADADARIVEAVNAAYSDQYLSSQTISGHWEPRKPDSPDRHQPPGWLGLLGILLGGLSEWIAWIVAAGLLAAFVVIAVRRGWRPFGKSPISAIPEFDDSVSEQAIANPAPLPDDIPAAARDLWRRGDRRGALALLYRGAIERAIERGAAIPRSATESQCLRRADELPESVRRVFSATIRAWQYAAYAHKPPKADDFDALAAHWAEAFGSRSGE